MPDQNQPTSPVIPTDDGGFTSPVTSNTPPTTVTVDTPGSKTTVVAGGGSPKRSQLIATIFGLLLLVGGVGAGIALVGQQQIFQQKAGGIACGGGTCANGASYGPDCNAPQASCSQRSQEFCSSQGSTPSGGGGPITCSGPTTAPGASLWCTNQADCPATHCWGGNGPNGSSYCSGYPTVKACNPGACPVAATTAPSTGGTFACAPNTVRSFDNNDPDLPAGSQTFVVCCDCDGNGATDRQITQNTITGSEAAAYCQGTVCAPIGGTKVCEPGYPVQCTRDGYGIMCKDDGTGPTGVEVRAHACITTPVPNADQYPSAPVMDCGGQLWFLGCNGNKNCWGCANSSNTGAIQGSGYCIYEPGLSCGASTTPAPISTTSPGGGTQTTPPGGPTAQCTGVRAYDVNNNLLTSAQLAALQPGDRVRFAVAGSASSGTFDRARFTINGTLRPEVTTKIPTTNEYYDEYVIPAGVTTFSITSQIHHAGLNQWY